MEGLLRAAVLRSCPALLELLTLTSEPFAVHTSLSRERPVPRGLKAEEVRGGTEVSGILLPERPRAFPRSPLTGLLLSGELLDKTLSSPTSI